MKVAILGAGYMGSAIAFPLSDNGVDVRLWGTWLDDELIAGAEKGSHPRLEKALRDNVRLFYSHQLEEALEDVDFAIVAVTSEGFLPVFEKLLPALDHPLPMFTVTKGFVEHEGRILSISTAARRLCKTRFGDREMGWVSVGGPVKAVDLSNEVPSATIFGYRGGDVLPLFEHFATPYYRVYSVPDVPGVEISSAFKNVYAITMGICDGLHEGAAESSYHNFKALLFNQAIREIAFLVETQGGRRETAFDLAGVGDLYVTSASGRNGALGRLIGAGKEPEAAYRGMRDADEVPEGYHSLQLGRPYIEAQNAEWLEKLPLLNALQSIIFEQADAREALFGFAARYDPAGTGDWGQPLQ